MVFPLKSEENHMNGSLYYVIPAEVMHDKNLDLEQKLLYALISGLSDKYGHCFASNRWFEEEMNIKEKALQRNLKILEEKGYIIRKIISYDENPFKRERHIYITAKFKKSLPAVENDGIGVVENDGIVPSKTADILSEAKNLLSKEEEIPPNPQMGAEVDKPPPILRPPKRKILKEEYLSRTDRVITTTSQHEALLKKANGDESLVKRWYETLSDWKMHKGIDGGSSDYNSINKWVIGEVAKNPSPISKTPENRIEWLKKVAQRVEHIPAITIGSEAISWQRGTKYEVIKFSDRAFKEQVIGWLRKLNLRVDDLL